MTTTPTRRRSMLFPLSREQLLPAALKGVPKPVAGANAAAVEAFDRWEMKCAEANRAEAEARAAPEHDDNAARSAAAVGEDPPPSIAPAKRAEALEARRAADAAELAAKHAVRDLYDTFEPHHDAYLEARREAVARAVNRSPVPSTGSSTSSPQSRSSGRCTRLRRSGTTTRTARASGLRRGTCGTSTSARWRSGAARTRAHPESETTELLAALALKLEELDGP